MILETKRLLLRKMKEDDFDDLCEILCDRDVMYAYEHAFSYAEVKEWMERQIQRYKEDGVGLWAMIRKEDHEMIGQCGITRQKVHRNDVWEIGYLLKKAYWHKGYASEAAKACKQYAFDVLNIDHVYSIIRDNNMASQHVAQANGMKIETTCIKHYAGMDMLHYVYGVQRQKKNEIHYHVYLDAEFDAVKIQRKFHQMVISIGAVMLDDKGNTIDTFYETVYPKGFQHMTRIVCRMTKLNDDIIKSSKRLDVVMQHFQDFVHQYDENHEHTAFYSFGPDDKRTILAHCRYENVEVEGMLSHVIDLQKPLSAHVAYKGQIVSKTLSLDDAKLIYQIQGEVEHNALNDAMDLMQLHQAYLHQAPLNETAIQKIVERKMQKEIEARKKQQKHFQKLMQKRFKYVCKDVTVKFYPDVLEQFRNWEVRDEHFKLHFKKDHVIFEERKYEYDALQIQMHIDTDDEIPSITLHLCCHQQEIIRKYILNYRNATPIENIIKRCLGECHES